MSVHAQGASVDAPLAKPRSPITVGSITTTGHSLGGALAALSAHDIHQCLKDEVLQRGRRGRRGGQVGVPGGVGGGLHPSPVPPAVTSMWDTTDALRDAFCRAAVAQQPQQQQPRSGGAPSVAAITFAAPRVGDINFAKAFGKIK